MKFLSWRWGLLAALIFIVFLLFTLPARHVLGWLGLGQVAMQGIEGSAWRGRIERLGVGNTVVGPLVWQARPWRVLSGRLEYQLFVQSGTGGGELRAGRSLFSGPYLADVALSLPAQEIARQLPLSMVTLGGSFLLDLQRVGLTADWVNVLDGLLVWQDAYVLQPARLELGSLNMQLALQAGQVLGTLSDQGGPLLVTGEFRLGQDRRYTLDAQIKPRNGSDADLKQALELLGTPDSQGRYRLNLSGAL